MTSEGPLDSNYTFNTGDSLSSKDLIAEAYAAVKGSSFSDNPPPPLGEAVQLNSANISSSFAPASSAKAGTQASPTQMATPAHTASVPARSAGPSSQPASQAARSASQTARAASQSSQQTGQAARSASKPAQSSSQASRPTGKPVYKAQTSSQPKSVPTPTNTGTQAPGQNKPYRPATQQTYRPATQQTSKPPVGQSPTTTYKSSTPKQTAPPKQTTRPASAPKKKNGALIFWGAVIVFFLFVLPGLDDFIDDISFGNQSSSSSYSSYTPIQEGDFDVELMRVGNPNLGYVDVPDCFVLVEDTEPGAALAEEGATGEVGAAGVDATGEAASVDATAEETSGEPATDASTTTEATPDENTVNEPVAGDGSTSDSTLDDSSTEVPVITYASQLRYMDPKTGITVTLSVFPTEDGLSQLEQAERKQQVIGATDRGYASLYDSTYTIDKIETHIDKLYGSCYGTLADEEKYIGITEFFFTLPDGKVRSITLEEPELEYYHYYYMQGTFENEFNIVSLMLGYSLES